MTALPLAGYRVLELAHLVAGPVWDALTAWPRAGDVRAARIERRVRYPRSHAVIVGAPGLPHYTAAKHGVLGLVKVAAAELNNSGIRVNAVCPGMVDTPMIQGWFASNPDLAQAVLAMMQTLAPDRERATLAVVAAFIVLVVPSAWGQVGAIILGAIIGIIFLRNAPLRDFVSLPHPVSRGSTPEPRRSSPNGSPRARSTRKSTADA